MAHMVLIMGESGTGKSTSIRNCDPAITAVINPVGKPLPFKAKFTILDNETESRRIRKFMVEQANAGKKLLVVDDFQYILSVPYMQRIKEQGWDKWNDFGSNYFEIINVCKELPDDVVVAYLTHSETLDTGVTTIKLIGKMLREKITIEGLFTIVLRTGVNEGKYYFYTQNSGKDTVKSPMGMFTSYAIDNDLNYVFEKIRNYYEIGNYKPDTEMVKADAAVSAKEVEKPEGKRRSRKQSAKTHDEVEAENRQKVSDYTETAANAVIEAADGADGVPFDEAMAAVDKIPEPELEKVPRRTRKERVAAQPVLTEDTYFYLPDSDNYVMTHAGDTAPEGAKAITKEEFGEGIKRISAENPVDTAMNPPEKTSRRRRRNVAQ